MSKNQADEHFPFEPVGPYTIASKNAGMPDQDGYWFFQEEVPAKRKSITNAKRLLKNGTFESVRVTDASGRQIFFQERQVEDAFLQNKELLGFLRILSNTHELSGELRSQVCALFSVAAEGMFKTSVGEAWNSSEDAAIKILYSTIGLRDMTFIGRILRRSDSAVSHRIKRLGLTPKASNRPQIF